MNTPETTTEGYHLVNSLPLLLSIASKYEHLVLCCELGDGRSRLLCRYPLKSCPAWQEKIMSPIRSTRWIYRTLAAHGYYSNDNSVWWKEFD